MSESIALTIAINVEHIHRLDLHPAETCLTALLEKPTFLKEPQHLRFEIDYPREVGDPRELSEIPEVRLWFLRLDARYPWLPLVLDWKEGELGRYTAMLVPHEFSRSEGIQFNPEALELYVMSKTFIVLDWLKKQGIDGKFKTRSMAQMLGYELEDSFFELLLN